MPQAIHIISLHSELAGLSANDHPQYTLSSYTNSISGYFETKGSSSTFDPTSLSGYLVGRDSSISGYFENKLSSITVDLSPLSGYLTGRDNSISGYLDGRFNNYYTKAQVDNISGYFINNPFNYSTVSQLSSLSGYNNSQYGTILSISNISGYLDNKFGNYYTKTQIDSLSGYVDNKTAVLSLLPITSGHIPYMLDKKLADTGITYEDDIQNVNFGINSISAGAISTDSISLYGSPGAGPYLQLPSLLLPASTTQPNLGSQIQRGLIYIDTYDSSIRINVSNTIVPDWQTVAFSGITTGMINNKASAISGYFSSNPFSYITNLQINNYSGYIFTNPYNYTNITQLNNTSGYFEQKLIDASGYNVLVYNTIANSIAISGYADSVYVMNGGSGDASFYLF